MKVGDILISPEGNEFPINSIRDGKAFLGSDAWIGAKWGYEIKWLEELGYKVKVQSHHSPTKSDILEGI